MRSWLKFVVGCIGRLFRSHKTESEQSRLFQLYLSETNNRKSAPQRQNHEDGRVARSRSRS
jgi:hypothetical protein